LGSLPAEDFSPAGTDDSPPRRRAAPCSLLQTPEPAEILVRGGVTRSLFRPGIRTHPRSGWHRQERVSGPRHRREGEGGCGKATPARPRDSVFQGLAAFQRACWGGELGPAGEPVATLMARRRYQGARASRSQGRVHEGLFRSTDPLPRRTAGQEHASALFDPQDTKSLGHSGPTTLTFRHQTGTERN
jgi:hypothetical protein